jgi:hypothetical protein
MILVQNRFSQWVLGSHYNAMCVWPLLFAKPGVKIPLNPEMLNHEKIHARQQLEMLWLFFFIWYGLEFLVHLVHYRNRHEAYRALSFEQEAYASDKVLDYLNRRKAFSWVKYLTPAGKRRPQSR